MPKLKLNCWIVCEEGLAGTLNQCRGVAEALGISPEQKDITLKQPWASLSPYIGLEQNWSFMPALEGPWPDLVIAGGRKAITACRYIKKKNPDTFITFLQDPRINPSEFDLVAVPEHDPTRGDNVLVTTATPNRITPETLSEARTEFPAFADLPSPRVAVLIGGSSKAYQMNKDITRKLAEQLRTLDARLMITASRRTGAENIKILREALSEHYFYDGDGPNPYFGMLAHADMILVTADSASMLSEACTTGKPVYMICLEGGHPRIDRLHENLQKSGALRVFDGALEHWEYEPLRDAELVANEIRKRMSL